VQNTFDRRPDMKSADYFRQLPNADLLLIGKENPRYSEAFTIAVVERLEDALDEIDDLKAELKELRTFPV
jgi:hypothetical protein